MKIIIGSKNPTKLHAVEEVFSELVITSIKAESKVSAQPFSDEETREGAINRALECADYAPNAIGIGLEGGVMHVNNQLFLCNWGALVTQNKKIYTASGARILLPEEINEKLKSGVELGEIMDSYAKKNEVRNNEGAIGIFTNNIISRKEMFAHVVKLLKGQWEYWGE